MRGRRTLIIIIVVLINVAFLGYLWLSRSRTSVEPESLVEETATPPPYVGIVVSAQDPIPRGWRFYSGDGATMIKQWPVEELPPSGYFSSQVQLENMYVIDDIPLGTPILSSMLSEAAVAVFPEGRVGYGVPMDVQGGLGWHIKEGDHVDVLAAVKLVNVDSEFQTQSPNMFQTLPEPTSENQAAISISGIYGRFETLPNGMAAMILPNGDPFAQVAVLMTVQDAIVWRIGAQYNEPLEEMTTAAATPESTEGSGGFLSSAQQPPATPAVETSLTNQRGDIELVTLLVAPQDALILKYLYEIGADLDLALRAPNDGTNWITGVVWSRYILDRYQIPQTPSDLPVALTDLRELLELTPVATPSPAIQ
jgi:Flp pilus assembly protein CpaB